MANAARRPVMLVILDGWGWRDDQADNAVLLADTPNFDRLWSTCPHAFLRTSGRDVGLPDGQMGNSEVGHLNIGAGRVVMQELPRITDAVESGTIADAPALQELIARLKASGGVCHLMGLVSPGGVHSHQDHAVGLAKILVAAGVPVRVHVWTDGRDCPPRSAGEYVAEFEAALPAEARIVTVCGRYYALDRDKRWDRVAKAYACVVEGEGERVANAGDAIAANYAKDVNDEFVLPSVVGDYAGMKDGDGVLCFNFRADRVREILGAMLDEDFKDFPRARRVAFAGVVGMTPYSAKLEKQIGVLFPAQELTKVIGEVVAKAGMKQLRMAETEKYPHVTYFLNGGEERQYEGEDRILVPSPKVATYDLQPEMSAPELTDKAVEAIRSGKYDMIVLNYANPDMVGHTGVLSAAIKAVETVDKGLGRIAAAIDKAGGVLLVTADHGNCELMMDPHTGGPHTAHTTNPVPLIVMGGANRLTDGRLADLAPTMLSLLGIQRPAEMNGRVLTG